MQDKATSPNLHCIKVTCAESYDLLFGLRFNSGMAIETTNPASRIALVREETKMVRGPSIKHANRMINPKK